MNKFNIKKMIKKGFTLFEEAMYPEYKCISCGEELQDLSDRICPECLSEIDFHEGKVCKICGAEISPQQVVCSSCKNVQYNFDCAISVCEYGNISGKIVKSLKYNGKKYVAKYMAKYMADTYFKSSEVADIITFVPQNPIKGKFRGFDHAELIANDLAKILNLPIKNMLMRVKDTPNQASLPRSMRMTNLDGAFDIIKDLDLRTKTVLLVDDVYTTGATANECSLMLKKANPRRIVTLTFAKTTDPNLLGA